MLLARYSIMPYKNSSGFQVQCCLCLKTEELVRRELAQAYIKLGTLETICVLVIP